ncbi:GTP-sensing pleiotropic transcriptional regulator CodY [Paenibacillus sp. KN14-4R]|uniref:GTP-sensing pleiotropic transcriptional regulator CodY n=1 Tax=Paenibacillus sp. KN14-4R TaxID=3445773 RepID=UPI003F9FC4F3
MTLLEKTRRLNKLLQQEAGNFVSFVDMAEVLRDVVNANVYVVGRNGKIFGYSIKNPLFSFEFSRLVTEEGRFPDNYNNALLKYNETSSNILRESDENPFPREVQEHTDYEYLSIVPIIGGRERLGTLVLSRLSKPFGDDDFVLAEYGATVVAMELLRVRSEEVEHEARNRAVVSVAIGSLSFSELEAVERIFEELDGKEGLLVASKIADRAGITRSVIVNALRKLESAGVIETRSLGMKGTYIRILNQNLLAAIEQNKLKS